MQQDKSKLGMVLVVEDEDAIRLSSPDFRIPFEVVYKPFDYSELESLVKRLVRENCDGRGS